MEREEKSREEIYDATGIWRGRDGNWRMEMPDLDVGTVRDILDWSNHNQEYGELKHGDGGWYSTFGLIASTMPKHNSLNRLIHRYPRLADVHLMVYDGKRTPDGYRAVTRLNPSDNYKGNGLKKGQAKSISIAREQSPSAVRSLLAHELQHFIQGEEGWMNGTTQKQEGGSDNVFALNDYLENPGEVEAHTVGNRAQYGKQEYPWETEARIVEKNAQVRRESEQKNATNVKAMVSALNDFVPGVKVSEVEPELVQGLTHGDRGIRNCMVSHSLASDIHQALIKNSDGKFVSSRRSNIAMSDMPEILKMTGIPDLPIETNVGIVRKLAGKHGLAESEITNLPLKYSDPVSVFRDGNEFVVLTDMQKEVEGFLKPVMVVLRPTIKENGAKVFLASAYARGDSEEDMYVNLANRGDMLYYDKSKSAKANLSGRTLSTLNTQHRGGHTLTPDNLPGDADSIAHESSSGNTKNREIISQPDGQVAGWYDRKTGEVKLVKGRATASTVAHEIGWHATFHWAEKNHPELHKKLIQYAKEAPEGIEKSVKERYGTNLSPEELLDEVGAERFTREDISPLLDAAMKRAAEGWFDNVEGAQDEVRGKFADAHKAKVSLSKEELDEIARLPPKQAVERIVRAMLEGRTLSPGKGSGQDGAIRDRHDAMMRLAEGLRKCGVRSAECGVRSSECEVRDAQGTKHKAQGTHDLTA